MIDVPRPADRAGLRPRVRMVSFPPAFAIGVVVVAAVAASARGQGSGSPSGGAPELTKPDGAKSDAVRPGTRRMAERLEKHVRSIDPEECLLLGAERVANLRKRLAEATGKAGQLGIRLSLAEEILKAGDAEAALRELDQLEADLSDFGSASLPEVNELMESRFQLRALCWLRLGELENCLAHHCCHSCIAPIEAGGQHTVRRGSENAIKVLMPLLEKQPDSESLRWLLNLAHMTLGTWPAGVPPQFLIGPECFKSEYELPRFAEVASACGLAHSTISGGVCLEDFDRDGFIDVMVSSMGLCDQMRYFNSNGDGSFTDRTALAGLTGLTGGLNMIDADYDNDGWTDVFVLRGGWLKEAGAMPNSLIRNCGDGTFEDVTDTAGVLSFHPTQTGAFSDLDGDGWLDLVVGNESQEHKGAHHYCELWLNRRDGTFKNVASEVGAEIAAFVKAVAVGDYDNDGRPDLFYSERGALNVLLRNVPDARPGGPGFKLVDVSRAAGIGGPLMSFPSWFFDYDNDGWQDLFVATNTGFGAKSDDSIGEVIAGRKIPQTQMPILYHNLGNGKFEDVTKKVGGLRSVLSMGSSYGDFDNDGWLDLYLGNGSPSLAALLPNKAFRNDGGKRFQDVTTSAGLGHLQKGHGVGFADLDNDGDQDIFCELGGFLPGDVYPNALFENPGSANHWVTLRLQGVKANRSAIGARIRVDLATPAGRRSLHLVCGTGGSFGASSLQQEIGLGDATAIEALFIRWPGSGTEQTLPGPALDQCYRIVEGSAACEPVAMKQIHLGGG